ncbi:MAG TPA: hypothetical protein VH854_12455 [Thermoanaerobaculia bacterium]|jgi:hypothetical protein|nr:hypothetical protein [Thermoanaerobaculia bacterium]
MKRISAAWILAALFAAAGCHKGEKAAAAPPADSGAAPAAAPAPTAPPPSKGGVMVTDKALMDGHLVEVTHSKWDGGQTSDMFDTNKDSLARTENANPAIIDIKLPEPRPLKGVSLTTGGMDAGLTVIVHPASGAAKTYTKDFRQMPPDPTFGLDFDTGSAPVQSVHIEIKDLNGGDGHVHIRTLKLR